jgi:hypothetical protein
MALEIDGMTYIIMCIKSYVNNLLVGYELRSGSEQVASVVICKGKPFDIFFHLPVI